MYLTADRVIKKNPQYYEQKKTKAPSVIIKVDFYDYKGATSINSNTYNIAEAIADGIYEYLGISLKKTIFQCRSTDKGDCVSAMKYYKEGKTHVVEVDPMNLRVSVQDIAANKIPLANIVTSGFQMVQAVKTGLPMFPTSRELIQKGKYLTYPVGILVSEGHIIQNRQPHGKPSGTLTVYKDGKVECKPVLNLLAETDYNNIWFAVSGCSIWPKIRMHEEGFIGKFADIGRITSRPVMGYREKDNKIIIAVRNSSNIYRGQLTLKNLGCDSGITLDAGGSTVLRVGGAYKFWATRRLFSIITW